MMSANRIFARLCAVLATLVAAAELSGAESALSRFKYGSRIVCSGEYSGHLQGIATDGEAIYWSFTRELVKTDLRGRIIIRRRIPRHGGDPCWYAGKLYLPVCESGFNRRLAPGTVSRNHIYVFDADLRILAKHHIPEGEFGAGGIAARDGHFFVVGGRPKGMRGNTVYEYDGDFKLVRRHELAFDSYKGIQTINFAFGKWYFGCYGTDRMTIETDAEFRVTRRLRPGVAVGMIPLANGLILVAHITKGRVHSRSSGFAKAVRFTAPPPVRKDAPPPER